MDPGLTAIWVLPMQDSRQAVWKNNTRSCGKRVALSGDEQNKHTLETLGLPHILRYTLAPITTFERTLERETLHVGSSEYTRVNYSQHLQPVEAPQIDATARGHAMFRFARTPELQCQCS